MLTPHDRQLLNFETAHEGPSPHKPQLIRRHLGITEATYYQALIRIMREPGAVQEFPQLVYRHLARRARLSDLRSRRLAS